MIEERDPSAEVQAWPLAAGFWRNHRIAGRVLAEWLPDLPEGKICERAWISREDGARLLASGVGSRLIDLQGEELARMAGSGGADLVASGSFTLCFPWQLLDVMDQILAGLEGVKIAGEVSPAAHWHGSVTVGEGTRILPGVVIEGPAYFGRHCKIGPNAYIRGGCVFGDHCIVGNAVEIKHSLVGDFAAIGHLSYVGDSVVDEDVNFGAGSIVSNFRHDAGEHRTLVAGELLETGRDKFGTVIGRGARLGIQTGIYPGRKIGPGLRTLPGEIVRSDLRVDGSHD